MTNLHNTLSEINSGAKCVPQNYKRILFKNGYANANAGKISQELAYTYSICNESVGMHYVYAYGGPAVFFFLET